MAENEQTQDMDPPQDNPEEIAADNEQQDAPVTEEAVNSNGDEVLNEPTEVQDEVQKDEEQAPAEEPAGDEETVEGDKQIADYDDQEGANTNENKSGEAGEENNYNEEAVDNNTYDPEDVIAAVEAAQIGEEEEPSDSKASNLQEPKGKSPQISPSPSPKGENTDPEVSVEQNVQSKPGSKAGSRPTSQTGSKPGTPKDKSRTSSQKGSKQPTPTGSKQPTPIGSKPQTPTPRSRTSSRPSSKVGHTDHIHRDEADPSANDKEAESRSVSVTEPAAAGARTASQAAQEAEGSRTGTPQQKEQERSASQAGSRGVTPQQDDQQRSASKGSSRNGTPQQERPASETGSQRESGSKAGTPKVGSRTGTPQGTIKEMSRPVSEVPAPASGTSKSVVLPEDGDIPDAPPPPAAPGISHIPPSSEERMSSSALNMIWSFGMNKHVPVLNLTDEARKMIMYSCAHTGVLYDMINNKQTLLQGHGNPISSTCCSEDKRWLATADRGHDSMIIIWDTYTGIPVRTIFDANPVGGVVAMAMTPDAKFIATLSSGDTQVLSIWDWTTESEEPVCSAELDPRYGSQHYILFNPEDTTQIVSNSESQVIFYSWEGGKIEYFTPPLTDDDFNKPVGKYSQSIFLSNSTRALTATSYGNLVVWDTNKPLTKVVSTESTPDKKALKLVRLQERGLNVLTTTEKSIVTGDQIGHIKFFDQTLKLTNWYQDFHLGPVNSISFAYEPEFDETANKNYPQDATIRAKKFAIRDFVVGTTTAVFAHVTTDGTDVQVIHRDHDAAVHGLASHPSKPWVAVGSYSGLLKVWDYKEKRPLFQRTFEQGQMIRCCTYDPEGKYLAVGFTNGTVRILESISLKDVCATPFRYARDVITHVVFSHDSRYLATADAEYTTTVFTVSPGGGDPWTYLGRYRAHYKLIHDIMFTVHLDSDEPKLLSVGMDRTLVEYDLEHSGKDDLKVAAWDRIEQSGVPLCTTMYPPITKESFLVTANDQFKFKMYNSTTKMCRKTLLGPTYGTPVQKMAVLPTEDPVNDKRYMAFITSDKVGLHSLPLDGNPHNAMALLAHPQEVANLAVSYDGQYVFTAGGVDATVHMWEVNTTALEAQAKLGGEGLIPFYGLLDGGKDGELFKELEDYFYYAQIRSQGVDTMDARNASTTIALSEVPYVMRAMGFYPSEQEIEDMLNEVKYSSYVETGKYMSEIELGDFIRLYVNHRPAFGLQADRLASAFELLGFNTEGGVAIDRGDLLEFLQSKGEHMTEYELAEYLTTLLGYNAEGGNCEQQEFDPSTAGDIIDEKLPQDITVNMFSNELLGFSMYNDVIDMEDVDLQERSNSEMQQVS